MVYRLSPGSDIADVRRTAHVYFSPSLAICPSDTFGQAPVTTPFKSRWLMIALANLSWLLIIPIFAAYMFRGLRSHWFPTDGDSIIIPIAGVTMFTLALWPIVNLLFIIPAYWNHHSVIPLFEWNHSRPSWSWTWSLFYGLVAVMCVYGLFEDVIGGWFDYEMDILSILCLYNVLCLRAGIVMGKTFAPSNNHPETVAQ